MPLAREMVKAGESRAVIHYLDLIARFWCRLGDSERLRRPEFRAMVEQNRERLRWWKEQVRAGRVPDDAAWL